MEYPLWLSLQWHSTAQVRSSRSIGKAGKNDTNVLNFANAIRQMYKL